MNLKLLSELYDQCQGTLTLFADFVQRHIDNDHYGKMLPALDVCLWWWSWWRVSQALSKHYNAQRRSPFRPPHAQNLEHAHRLQARGRRRLLPHAPHARQGTRQDHSMPLAHARGAAVSPCRRPQKIAARLAKIDEKLRTGKEYLKATEEVLAEVRQQVQVFHPPKVWSIITPELYTTFWTLSLYDLEVPRHAYTTTTKHAKDALVRAALSVVVVGLALRLSTVDAFEPPGVSHPQSPSLLPHPSPGGDAA